MNTDKKTHGSDAPKRRGRIEKSCRDKGLRMTGQRQIIAAILDAAEDHPDVFDLHRRASAIDGRISLSTVYRTTRLFEQEGIIERLDLRESRARFEPTTKGHHAHLVDIETGKVIEFQSPEIEELQAEIARKLGYRIVSRRLELYAVPTTNGDDAP